MLSSKIYWVNIVFVIYFNKGNPVWWSQFLKSETS